MKRLITILAIAAILTSCTKNELPERIQWTYEVTTVRALIDRDTVSWPMYAFDSIRDAAFTDTIIDYATIEYKRDRLIERTVYAARRNGLPGTPWNAYYYNISYYKLMPRGFNPKLK